MITGQLEVAASIATVFVARIHVVLTSERKNTAINYRRQEYTEYYQRLYQEVFQTILSH